MSSPAARRIALDPAATEDDIAAHVDSIREQPELREHLVDLLPQGHSLYAGRGANQVGRIRGYILASFEITGLPESALVYVLEELENSQRPYLVAAAAKALRGLAHPFPELARFLLAAITNIQYRDDALSFESYKTDWPLPNHTTALTEILTTLRLLGAQAQPALSALQAMQSSTIFSKEIRAEISKAVQSIESDRRAAPAECCSVPSGKCCAEDGPQPIRDVAQVADVQFEDQDGNTSAYTEVFRGKPAVAAFFYTRCSNPNKCSLTVTKLGQLQGAIAEAGLKGQVRLAAVTYDPGHDTPEILRGYCRNRGLLFDADNRAWRTAPGHFTSVRDFFELGANYSGSVVSRHHIELYILNEAGQIVTTYSNLQWDVRDVLGEVQALLAK